MKEVAGHTALLLEQPVAEALALFSQVGLTLAEVYGSAPTTHIDLTDESAVAALADTLTGLPIQSYSIHAPFNEPSRDSWEISQLDEAKRRAAVQGHIRILQASAVLGVQYVVIHPSGPGPISDRHLPNCRASLEQMVPTAQDLGIRIAVENMAPERLGGTLAQMRQLLAGFDPQTVGFCLDTGHAHLGPDSPADYIRALSEHLIGIHWNDNHGTEDEHLFPGFGTIAWDEFFTALAEVGYDSPVTLEAFVPEGMRLAEAVRLAQKALAENRAPISPPVVLHD